MSSTNAIELLKSDHETVKHLLTELVETTKRARKKRAELLARIKKELSIHTTLEEEIFYPAFKDANGDDSESMYFEAREEHRAVEKLVLPDLEKTSTDGDEFHGRAKVLKELVEHHADEEESDMFPQARQLLGDDMLRELGERMAERKRELEQQR